MIAKTFYDGNPEDRRYVEDYWSWLQYQPQDAWLLWARTANWDNAETIFERMLDNRACDLGLVSWLFWHCDPASCLENPKYYHPNSLIRKIVENVNRSSYESSELFYDRYEVAMSAHQYLKMLRKVSAGQMPFELPRVLCGPFGGRHATIPARYDNETERDLAELFRHLDGGLPRTEAEHSQNQTKGGNDWLKGHMRLPSVPPDPISTYRHLDDAAYIEAIFGRNSDYDAALAKYHSGVKPRRSWWPFS